jgi:lactose/L-arabinose transport system permease protein
MKRKKKAGPNYNRYGWAFIAAAFLLYLIFTIYPAVESLALAFQSLEGGKYIFVGLKNFKRMFGDAIFLQSLKNTFLYMIIQVPVMLMLALLLAVMLNSRFLKWKGMFRTSIFLPCVTSLVAYSILFKMMFSLDGIVNQLLMHLGILEQPYQFLQNSTWARAVIIIAMLWRWTGYNVIFYLSALQNIPKETFEAAKVDGANAAQTLFRVTIPQLKPIVLLTAIMSTNGTLQLFDETMNITQGGPANSTLTVSHYIYNQSFVYAPNFGYASAISYMVVFLMIILAIIQFSVAGKEG